MSRLLFFPLLIYFKTLVNKISFLKNICNIKLHFKIYAICTRTHTERERQRRGWGERKGNIHTDKYSVINIRDWPNVLFRLHSRPVSVENLSFANIRFLWSACRRTLALHIVPSNVFTSCYHCLIIRTNLRQ